MANMQIVNSAILKLNAPNEVRMKQFRKKPKHKSISSLTKSSNIIKSYYKNSFNHCELANVRIALVKPNDSSKLEYKLYKPQVFTRLNKTYSYTFQYLVNKDNVHKYNSNIKSLFKTAHCETLYIYMR